MVKLPRFQPDRLIVEFEEVRLDWGPPARDSRRGGEYACVMWPL